jgi:hypothetical protein
MTRTSRGAMYIRSGGEKRAIIDTINRPDGTTVVLAAIPLTADPAVQQGCLDVQGYWASIDQAISAAFGAHHTHVSISRSFRPAPGTPYGWDVITA